MKKYIIVVVVVIVAGIVGWMYFKLKSTKKELQIARVELAVQNDSIASFRTKDSTLVSIVKAVEIDRNALKQSLEELGLTVKQLKNEKIKWQTIATVLQAKLESQGSGTIAIHDTIFRTKTDTIHAGKFNWSNKFLFLNGKIQDKSIDFNYLYKTDITAIQSKVKNGTQISLILSDPNAKITTGSSIVVNHKKSLAEKWYLVLPIGIFTGLLIAK